LSTNKSKTSWNINNNNEIGTASSKKFSQTEFKLCNKIIGTNQSAKNFNNYFINSVDELIKQQTNTESTKFSLRELFPYEFPQINNISITEAEVICAISSLKNKTSCGYDGLSNKILKVCSSQISKPITYVINKSLTCGICPHCLQYAIIKPSFKRSDKSRVSNYRPISFLNGFSKIFELLIFHRLKHYLVSNYLLVNEQFNFHDNVSTDSVIFKLIESIFNAWNNKEYVMDLLCDPTKAFDSVSYELLILKL